MNTATERIRRRGPGREAPEQPPFAARIANDYRVQRILRLQAADDPRVRCDLDEDAYLAAVDRWERGRRKFAQLDLLEGGGDA